MDSTLPSSLIQHCSFSFPQPCSPSSSASSSESVLLAPLLDKTKNKILSCANGVLVVELNQQESMLCDDRPEVWILLRAHKYCTCDPGGKRGMPYVQTSIRVATNKQKCVLFHRQIHPSPPGLVVDHISGDKLDNRIANLRNVTQAVNSANRIFSRMRSTSGVLGVSNCKTSKCWTVCWVDDDGKKCQKAFSYRGRKKTSEEEFRKAVAFRSYILEHVKTFREAFDRTTPIDHPRPDVPLPILPPISTLI
jgi:hypothetical protein